PGIKNSNTTRTCIVSCRWWIVAQSLSLGSITLALLSSCAGAPARLSRQVCCRSKRNFRQGKLGFHGNLKPLAHPKTFSAWIRTLFRNDWHVYSKRPFGGAVHALCYLGHYTQRGAISNHRLVSLTDDQVTFPRADSARTHEHKLMPLSLDAFLRRFLLHLSKGFVRIRHFGFLANRPRTALLPLCFQLLGTVAQSQIEQESPVAKNSSPLWCCPKCGGEMVVIERLTAAQIQLRSPPWLAGAAA